MAYSFDAGPNAFIFYESQNASLVEDALRGFSHQENVFVPSYSRRVESIHGEHSTHRLDTVIFSSIGGGPSFSSSVCSVLNKAILGKP